MKRKICGLLIVIVAFTGILLTGCSSGAKEKKVSDLDYTVIGESDIPEELRVIIEDKQTAAFKLTYSSKDFLYIAVGYGTQATGGYSITVDNLYLGENGIYVNTNLIGPSEGEVQAEAASYPYIVIKMPYREERVIFDA